MAKPLKGLRVTDSSLGFLELSSQDPSVSRSFLEQTFGWKFSEREVPEGRYFSFQIPSGGAGGVRPTRPTEAPSSLGYVRVPDLKRAQEAVEAHGAQIVLPRVDVPGMGSFFWFKVPGGPVLACWQDAVRGPEGADR